MIINEKALIKAMNAAKKGGGYRCWVDGRRTVIYTGFWAVVSVRLPRKVLGLLVEHMGTLPEDGDTWLIVKKDVQKELTPFGQDVIEALERENGTPMKLTPLTLNGYELWQKLDDGKILAFDPVLTALAEAPVALAIQADDRGVAAFIEEDNKVFVFSTEVNGQKELERVMWVR